MKKLMNLDRLPCCHRRAAVLLCLLLWKTLGYHQLYWFPTLWFINCLVCNFSKIHWPGNNKKLINLDCLACYCRLVVVLFCLLLLTAPSDIISFLDFQCFIDLSIAPFVSLLKYIDLLTTKKLINLDHLAYCLCCVCYFQYFQIFHVNLSDQLITIMLMNLDCLVVVAIAVCFVLQSLFALFYCYCLSRPVIVDCLVLLMLSTRLIELTLVKGSLFL